MLVYDRDHPAAAATAGSLQRRLPVGYLVVAAQDLPPEGTVAVTPAMVRNSWAWVDADGTRHHGRRGLARALRACGGRDAVLSALLVLPGTGRPIVARLVSGPATTDVSADDDAAGPPGDSRD